MKIAILVLVSFLTDSNFEIQTRQVPFGECRSVASEMIRARLRKPPRVAGFAFKCSEFEAPRQAASRGLG